MNSRRKKNGTHTAVVGGHTYNLTREGWSEVLQKTDAAISDGLNKYGTMQEYIDIGLKAYSTVCRLRYTFLFKGNYERVQVDYSLESRLTR